MKKHPGLSRKLSYKNYSATLLAPLVLGLLKLTVIPVELIKKSMMVNATVMSLILILLFVILMIVGLAVKHVLQDTKILFKELAQVTAQISPIFTSMVINVLNIAQQRSLKSKILVISLV